MLGYRRPRSGKVRVPGWDHEPWNRTRVPHMQMEERPHAADDTADEPRPGPAALVGDVVGQDAELARIGSFLDDVSGGPAALLLEGDIGAGKTTLWRATTSAARERGYRVMASHPGESEATMAFAALGDLLDGVLDDPGVDIPSPQLRAVRVAALMADPDGPEPDQRSVSVGTLGLVRSLADRSPVLIAVDDYQWIDPATVRVLRFLMRRLEHERVGFVAASRDGNGEDVSQLLEGAYAERDARRVRPAPLGPDALDSLFRLRLGESFPRPVLRSIAAASGGNALFGLEIARGILSGDVRAQPGQRLPVPASLVEMVRDRVAGLPAGIQELLFVAAAASEPTVDLLEKAIPTRNASEGLDLAARAGVVEVEGGQVRFTHPLFASALYHAIDLERRRVLHRLLATLVTGAHERARHLSLGTATPDADIATALVEAARAAAARGAPDAAATLSEHAWRITPTEHTDDRRERRLLAAEHSFASGDTARARAILEETLGTLGGGPVRADVLRRLAKVRYRNDSASVAAELLTRALAEAGTDPSLRAAIERDLAWAVTLCGDVRDAAQHATSALRMIERTVDDPLMPEVLAASGMASFLLGEGIQPEIMQRAVELERPRAEVPIEWRPSMILAVMSKWSGDLSGACERLQRLYELAIEAGDETSLPYLLAQLSETETWLGEWPAALDHAEEGHRLALQTGQEPIRGTVLYSRALVQAHLGRVDEARASARLGFELSEKAGSVISMMQNQSVLGFLDLSLDHPTAADDRLAPLVTWLDVVGIREPGVLRFVPDEVEALIAIGRLDKAHDLLSVYEADASRLGRSWALLASARARAMHTAAAGDAGAAAAPLEQAVEAYGDDRQPFAKARALLALGTIQRRTRRRKAARASLQAALRIFEGLGASLWAAKARRMLGDDEGGETGVAATLTPAERRVADLVASGMSNRLAADRLFVSVRAVEVHLTSVYRKLGIRSRTQLAAMMPRPGPGETPDRARSSTKAVAPVTGRRADTLDGATPAR